MQRYFFFIMLSIVTVLTVYVEKNDNSKNDNDITCQYAESEF